MTRQCGTCSVCCYVSHVTELDKPAMTRCQFQRDTVEPCSCYHSRPAACQTYQCTWHQGLLREDMRPDRCGVVLETMYSKEFEPNLTIFAGIIVDDELFDLVFEDLKELVELMPFHVLMAVSESRYHVFGGEGEQEAWEHIRASAMAEGRMEVRRPDGVEVVNITQGDES